jgi:flagellin
MAQNAGRHYGVNRSELSQSLEKLSSGYSINRAGDNAAGLGVSEKMRSQIKGIDQAVSNAKDGISMVQTFEGALSETHKILQRFKTLATQSANGIYDDEVDRAAIELEYEQLCAEIDDIAQTDFNGVIVLATHSKTEKRELIGYESDGIDAKEVNANVVPDGVNWSTSGGEHYLDSYQNVVIENGTITSPSGWQAVTRIEPVDQPYSHKFRYKDTMQYIYFEGNQNGTVEFIVPKDPTPIYEITQEATKNPESVSLQVGARTKDLKKYDFNYQRVWHGNPDLEKKAINKLEANIDATASGLGLLTSQINLGSQTSANKAIDSIENAINKISMIRATFGSIQNRLEHKVDNLNQTNESLTASESRIRDTDMATEMMKFSKDQILVQASQTMLSQANGVPQGALQLLQ